MVKVLIDSREPDKIIEKAQTVWKECEKTFLEVGDIVCLENNVCIELKRILDFVGSVRPKKGMSSGRIFQQCSNMTSNFTNPYLIIVGSFDKVSKSPHVRFTIEQFLGAQASITARYGVPVFHVQNNSQCFKLASALIRKSGGEKKELTTITRSVPKTEDIISSIISAFPGVGPSKAVAIKDHFDIQCASDLVNLSEDDLKDVNGVGFVQAKSIKKFFY
jgi:ERCC4-type nuclease